MICQLVIKGTVAPGFESIETLYKQNMETMLERNTQLCVYFEGEKVVDLWGSVIGDESFSADSLVNAFSSGKSLESIAVGYLVSQGLVAYGDKVSVHWPEFASHGKQEITIADLLRHESGLATFVQPVDPDDLLPASLKNNEIGGLIEAHEQKFRPSGKRREYHALTRGWIINEVFRRMDPRGRTIGEYLRQELSRPLSADVVIGLAESELDRRSLLSVPKPSRWFIESLKPRFLNRRIERNFFEMLALWLAFIHSMRDSSRLPRNAFSGKKGLRNFFKIIDAFNDREIAMGETPSANTHASARGFAKLAAMMADKGSFEGKEFLSVAAWDALHASPTKADMGFISTRFTQGGVAAFNQVTRPSSRLESELNNGRGGFFGWMGLGGSLFQWHPEFRIGVGYVPTSLNVMDIVNERGKSYQEETLKCIMRMKS